MDIVRKEELLKESTNVRGLWSAKATTAFVAASLLAIGKYVRGERERLIDRLKGFIREE